MAGKIPDDPPSVEFGVDYPFAIVRAFCNQRGEDRSVTITESFLTEPLDWLDNVNTWDTILAEEDMKLRREREQQKTGSNLLGGPASTK